jgi:tetratricopeptide (TPR) repeat protein
MKSCVPVLTVLMISVLIGSCTAPPRTTTPSREESPPRLTKEGLSREGHSLYLRQRRDSAAVLLEAALALDSSYRPALEDLAALYYDCATSPDQKSEGAKRECLQRSHILFARLEALGGRDAELYERLCETAVALGDSVAFLRYARSYAERYPYDRQYYNLGLAYLGVSDFQGVVRSQKEAANRFATSEYIGGFYRQMGRAYMKLDRDQTAERTLAAGVQAADARMSAIARGGGADASGAALQRLKDDKIAMLLMLKKLHQTYRAADKLDDVERQLKQAGYVR